MDKWRYFLLSCSLFACYILGLFILSNHDARDWLSVPAFGIGMTGDSIWIKAASFITVFSGVALIYFVPGIFFVYQSSASKTFDIELWAKGFLLNYSFYYCVSTLYKLAVPQEFSREVFLITISFLIFIYGAWLLRFWTKSPGMVKNHKDNLRWHFLLPYIFALIIISSICGEKIFLSLFSGDGAEQYWTAYSLKSNVLPSAFDDPVTVNPQFAFAPSLYLNMFALILFGDAEFVMRIEVLVAFMCLGIILRDIVLKFCPPKKANLLDWIPLILYLASYFLVICYRADYESPVDLAKSNETLQLALFFVGYYFLLGKNKEKEIWAGVFFILSALIRYNGMMMVTCFILAYSVTQKNGRALFCYVLGLLVSAGILAFALSNSSFSFVDAFTAMLGDQLDNKESHVDWEFVLDYIKTYILLTSGAVVFLLEGLKNKHILLLIFVTVAYLSMPVQSVMLPAHFFAPIFFFPILGYYFNTRLYQRDMQLFRMVVVSVLIFMNMLKIYPQNPPQRNHAFEKALSQICLNTHDLYLAHQRSVQLGTNGIINNRHVIMYYSDRRPVPGKEYLIYFHPMPPGSADQYSLLSGAAGEGLYYKKKIAWGTVKGIFYLAGAEYTRESQPFLTRSKYYNDH